MTTPAHDLQRHNHHSTAGRAGQRWTHLAPIATASPPGVLATTFGLSGHPLLAVFLAVVGAGTAALTAVACSPTGEALAHGRVTRALIKTAAKEARICRPSQVRNAVTLTQAITPEQPRQHNPCAHRDAQPGSVGADPM